MAACWRAWSVAQRTEEKKVPAVNRFAKMGLKTRSVGLAPRETPTATCVELETFRAKALELGASVTRDDSADRVGVAAA